jgi:uncharacterized membrane protein HdeD (DUF308 family)
MALLDWILVVFGIAVAFIGSWIQLHPERIIPGKTGSPEAESWPLDPVALAQIRLLGGCFLFMGAFFALQMTIDLTRLPWWAGTVSGLVTAIAAVVVVHAQVDRQQREGHRFVQQSPLASKALELR